MQGPYQPVACAFHERLEFAVLRRQPLRLRYRHDDTVAEAVVLPLDVQTRDGAEWLSCRGPDDTILVLRLDALLEAVPHTGA